MSDPAAPAPAPEATPAPAPEVAAPEAAAPAAEAAPAVPDLNSPTYYLEQLKVMFDRAEAFQKETGKSTRDIDELNSKLAGLKSDLELKHKHIEDLENQVRLAKEDAENCKTRIAGTESDLQQAGKRDLELRQVLANTLASLQVAFTPTPQ